METNTEAAKNLRSYRNPARVRTAASCLQAEIQSSDPAVREVITGGSKGFKVPVSKAAFDDFVRAALGRLARAAA